MINGTYYLNNSGSRWINIQNGKRERITLKTQSGTEIVRSVIYWQSFGNFAMARISYQGQRINVFPDSTLRDGGK